MAQPVVTVKDLLERCGLTEEDSNRKIEYIDLDSLSHTVGKEWRSLLLHLGMPDITLNDIERNRNFMTEQEKRYGLFSQWKKLKGSEATYRNFISAFLKINNTADAEVVCHFLKDLGPESKFHREYFYAK